MKLHVSRRASLAAALLLLALAVVAQVAIPPLKSRVTDLTNTLTPEQRAALAAELGRAAFIMPGLGE